MIDEKLMETVDVIGIFRYNYSGDDEMHKENEYVELDDYTPSVAPAPSKELLASLQEIEDYKNGKIELESYEDAKSLSESLIND